MNILDKIVADKRKEVGLRKSLIPVKQLENSVLFNRVSPSLGRRFVPVPQELSRNTKDVPPPNRSSIKMKMYRMWP